MISTPVTSTLIATVDYDGEMKILTVHFHGGKRVAIAPVSAAEYVAFLSAGSKGSFFHRVFGPRLNASIRIDTPAPIALREPLPIGPLETFHHDDCCTKHLQKANRDGTQTWECPECGTGWEKVQRGELFNWEPRPSFFLVRPRRA